MKRKSLPLIATSLLALSGLLFTASAARADDDDARCTNRSLRGEFGFASTGWLLGTPGLPAQAPFRSLGLAHFNGKGGVTWLEHTVINGQLIGLDWTTASGTYEVNANCTGTAVVTTPNSPAPLKFAFTIVKEGKEVRALLDNNAIETVFTKIE